MKKLIPLLVVGILVLSGLGAVAVPEKESLNKQEWAFKIEAEGGFLGYEVTVTNVGNETINGSLNISITTDAWFMLLGEQVVPTHPFEWDLVPDASETRYLRPVIGFGPATINISGVFTHEIGGEYPFVEETGGIIWLIYVTCGHKPIIISP